jgi:hypothetical protein
MGRWVDPNGDGDDDRFVKPNAKPASGSQILMIVGGIALLLGALLLMVGH